MLRQVHQSIFALTLAPILLVGCGDAQQNEDTSASDTDSDTDSDSDTDTDTATGGDGECAVKGDTDRSIELLERAVEKGWGDRAWLETDSDLDSVRDDPRFAALLDRIH